MCRVIGSRGVGRIKKHSAFLTLFTADADGSTNRIAGEPAFTGTDGGEVAGSWGRSFVNLAPYA
jgi:hypothetical protein